MDNNGRLLHSWSEFLSCPYIDDFGGAELESEVAYESFGTLQGVLREVGLEMAPHKTCEQSTSMVWLGILVNSMDLTLSIPQNKLYEIQDFVGSWNTFTSVTKRQVQSSVKMITLQVPIQTCSTF